MKRVGEAAAALGVSPATVRGWVKKGYITAVRLPSGHRRIPEAELRRLLAQMFDAAPGEEEDPDARKVLTRPVTGEEWGP